VYKKFLFFYYNVQICQEKVRRFKLLNVAGIIAKSKDGVAAIFNLSTAASTDVSL
jgi:hypothetical protein